MTVWFVLTKHNARTQLTRVSFVAQLARTQSIEYGDYRQQLLRLTKLYWLALCEYIRTVYVRTH